MISVLPARESQRKLIDEVCHEFERAVHLIDDLDDGVYTTAALEKGGIGAHFRHNIEIAQQLLSGLESGLIDYGDRKRNQRLETSRQVAAEHIGRLISQLSDLSPATLEAMIAVRSEIDRSACYLSTVMRELEFLHSHTIHHHAIISSKLLALDIVIDANFGVAPSTLRFWSDQTDPLPGLRRSAN